MVLSRTQFARQGNLLGSTWFKRPISMAIPQILKLRYGATYYAISWVDTWKVDLADKLDGGRLVWVLVAAVHLQ